MIEFLEIYPSAILRTLHFKINSIRAEKVAAMYNCMIKDFLEVNFKTLTGSIKSFKDYKKE